MSKINQGLTLAVAGAALAYLFFTTSKAQKAASLELACSEEQLLKILDEMRLEYTPYYMHYYHLLTALEKEYRGKP